MNSFRYPDFGVCNHTELYQLCRTAGIQVAPNFSDAKLAKLLISDKPNPTGVVNPIDSWRKALAAFVGARWSQLQPQIKCPLKSSDGNFDPDACFRCLDVKVIACVVSNNQYKQLIEGYRE